MADDAVATMVLLLPMGSMIMESFCSCGAVLINLFHKSAKLFCSLSVGGGRSWASITLEGSKSRTCRARNCGPKRTHRTRKTWISVHPGCRSRE